MKKASVIATSLIILASALLATSTVYASPVTIQGTLTGTVTDGTIHIKGGIERITNIGVVVTFSGDVSGTFTGTATAIVNLRQGSISFYGSGTFVGSMGASTGTATLQFVGTATIAGFQGNFVMTNGTGGFSHEHAQGMWNYLGAGPGTYSGTVYT